jgi:hypothetical protein
MNSLPHGRDKGDNPMGPSPSRQQFSIQLRPLRWFLVDFSMVSVMKKIAEADE